MERWHFPAWCGDYRIVADGDGSELQVEDPTPAELTVLGKFLTKARKKGWIGAPEGIVKKGETRLHLGASVTEAGRALLGRGRKGVITAVRSVKGVVTVETDDDKVEKAVANKDAETAASVRRPTLCCPYCVAGPDVRASRVLETFSSPSQRRDWEREGFLYATGGLSGRRYQIVHRHHPLAIERGKIVFDLEAGAVMHAYDWSVPPAEEVLAAKLVLEHREDWIRNPSAMLWCGPDCYPHPLMPEGRDGADGLTDAAFMRGVGIAFQADQANRRARSSEVS